MGLPPLKIRKEHIHGFPQGRLPRPRLIDPCRFRAGVVVGAVENRAGGSGALPPAIRPLKPSPEITKNQEPRTKNQEPRTKNPEPRTQNQEPRTQNPEPGTRNQEPSPLKHQPFTAVRQRIQCRRSRQASGPIRPRTPSRVLASGTGTNSLLEVKPVAPE